MSTFWKNLLILLILTASIILPQVGGALSAFAAHGPSHITEEDLGGTSPTAKPKTNQPAAGEEKKLPDIFENPGSDTGCVWWALEPGKCAIYLMAWVSFTLLKIIGVVLEIAGLVFNATLGVTMDNSNYTAETVPALKAGWEFSRDIVNLFFIFILLFIAIATILGVEPYSAKRLLVTLIIMALLVNFSFLIAQAIIFISNALTVELYSLIPDSQYSYFPSTSKLLSLDYSKDISGAITDAFAPQKLISNETIPQDVKIATGVTLFIAMIEISIIGIIMILAASFVLFAGAFFLIARLIIFWFLLIFAPFGFVFMILPQTKGYANKWWKTLSDQAIFAPAFLFMLVLAIMVVQSGLASFLPNVATKSAGEFLFLLFLQGTVMVGLVIGCLIIAKSMGAYGANAAMGMAQNYGKMFGNYARAVPGRTARRAAGPLAEAFASGEGTGRITKAAAGFGNLVRKVPLAGGLATAGAVGIAAANRKRIDELQKNYAHYTDKELKNRLKGASGFNKTAIVQELTKRDNLRFEPGTGLDEGAVKSSISLMKKYGISTRDVERLRPDLAEKPREAVKFHKPETVSKLDESLKDNPEVIEGMLDHYKAGQIQKLVERGDGLYEVYRTQLLSLGTTLEEISEALEKRGNTGAASWIKSTAAKQLIAGLDTLPPGSPTPPPSSSSAIRTPSGPRAITAGKSYSETIKSAPGIGVDSWTATSGLQPWMRLDVNTGDIEANPPAGTSGSFPVSIVAKDKSSVPLGTITLNFNVT